jgi:Cyclin, C-terminal domain/Cyclin, N-terminal domain
MLELSQIQKEDRQAEDMSETARVVDGGNTNDSQQHHQEGRTLSPNAIIMPVLPSDVLPSLLAFEEQTRSQHDHQILASSSLKTLPNSIWRERVVVWMYSIADHLRESRSIVSVATSILDRYAAVLASSTEGAASMDSLRYEVASMTALFLAVRVAGSGNLSVQQLLAMRRHSKIMSEDIVKVGSDMVKLLSWKRRLVTPAHFLAKFLEVIPNDAAAERQHDDVGHSARYLIEMSICDTCLSRSKPSDVALAALMNVLRADAPSMLDDFVEQVLKITSVDALSDRISSIRRRLHRLYSLSYDVRRPNLPHVVMESEDVSSDDVAAVPSFHSSAAVRTISDDDLCGKWGGQDECGPSKRPSEGPADEHAPRLKRAKTGLHLSALC